MSKEVNEERAPRTITDVKEMLSKHSNGEIQRTIQNCITILQNDHVLADAIRLNLLSERIDIVKPVGWPRSGKTLNDTDMKYILRRMEKYGISSEKKIESAIRIVANENRYHPIRDYLNGLKWDGTERIAHVLHHLLGAAEDEYTCEAMKIFLLGAIKRVFQPGCKFETMLCLVGGQGAGKSTFFRLLAVKDEWFSDDLRRLDDDNVYRKLQGHWIIEMSEMIATANAKSIEEIKSFLSKQKETYKVPYETHPADRLRQCVFAGTTNRQDFLPRDRTGNRRFIPIPVDAELAEVHILDNLPEREIRNRLLLVHEPRNGRPGQDARSLCKGYDPPAHEGRRRIPEGGWKQDGQRHSGTSCGTDAARNGNSADPRPDRSCSGSDPGGDRRTGLLQYGDGLRNRTELQVHGGKRSGGRQ